MALLLIATMITIPGVYFLFQDVLLPQLQYYSVQIGFAEVGITLFIMFSLGLGTIMSQTLKAANANPVENLRSE